MSKLQMKDRPDCITVAAMRTRFERAINGTPRLKESTPLGVMEINGEFDHYMSPDTDTMWIGFALGLRFAEREHKAIVARLEEKVSEANVSHALD
jgi:hypothetical protein